MSKLDELIQELCPDGVIYRNVSDVAEVSIGEFVHKSKQNPDGKYPVYNGGTSNTGYYDDYNRTADKIIISARGANAGFVNRVFTNYWSGNSCYTVGITDKNLDWNFAFYWFKSNELSLLGEQQKGGIPAVSKKQVERFRIPVPPLPVQSEIVRILDNFTELAAELAAELTARRKQYEHYRDELLTFGDNVPKATLGEICDFKYGKGNNIPSEAGEYPVYGCNGIVSTTNVFNSEDAPIIGHIGSAGIVNWGAGKHYVTYNGTICKANPEKVLSKYVYHLLCSLHLERFVKGSQPFLSYGDFSKEIVSVPTLAEQQRVITLLDHFDTICNDLVSGLPAEIEARQKQYEYYRDKLLTFKELER